MKILVVGSGGREHTLCWKISQSKMVDKIYCAPGNAGTASFAENIAIEVDEINKLVNFCKENEIELVVIGPELPLTLGLTDKLEEIGIKVFGPSALAAEIEGSKAFSKMIMERYDVPTAKYKVFIDYYNAKNYLNEIGIPCVIKADGLAQGKGVFVCMTREMAEDALEEIMGEKSFGDAGNRVLIEEYLEGQEVSILAFTDGNTIIPMVSAQDHKRIFDNDEGPNTGGMGAYSPAPMYTKEMENFVFDKVFKPVIGGMKKEGRLYKGVLYAGLMLTEKGIKVLEFNARFGDPEAQVVLTRLKTDLVEIMLSVVEERLEEQEIIWQDKASVCVVMSAEGYPGEYVKGREITFKEADDKIKETTYVFHAGTEIKGNKVITCGGRILGITALGSTIKEAIENVYLRVKSVDFKGAHYREDIGKKALR